jgi:hypothetical protein
MATQCVEQRGGHIAGISYDDSRPFDDPRASD